MITYIFIFVVGMFVGGILTMLVTDWILSKKTRLYAAPEKLFEGTEWEIENGPHVKIIQVANDGQVIKDEAPNDLIYIVGVNLYYTTKKRFCEVAYQLVSINELKAQEKAKAILDGPPMSSEPIRHIKAPPPTPEVNPIDKANYKAYLEAKREVESLGG